MRKLVIATDGSPGARQATETGLGIAAETGASVTFVHVVPAERVEYQQVIGAAGVPLRRDPVDDSETVLAEAEAEANARGIACDLSRLAGDPVEGIVACAADTGADLIVVGSRGRGRVAAAVLGSVALGVIRSAGRPVVVVRAMPAPVAATA